jgi:hypothetical protein
MSNQAQTANDDREKTVRLAATAVAAVFLLVGILGFIPGITSDYDSMSFGGHMSGAELLGIFQVSILHNIVHLLFGVVGLALARRTPGAVNYLLGGGVIYLVLWIYGLVVSKSSDANFVPLNTADDWLHFVLGLGMLGLGIWGRSALRDRTTGSTARA